MINKILIRLTMIYKLSHSRAGIDALTDVRDESLEEGEGMDTRPDSVIVLLTGMIIGGLSDGIAGIGVDMLAKRCIAAVVVAVIALEDGAPCSHAEDVRSVLSTLPVSDTDVSVVVRNAAVAVWSDMLACIGMGVVADIDKLVAVDINI